MGFPRFLAPIPRPRIRLSGLAIPGLRWECVGVPMILVCDRISYYAATPKAAYDGFKEKAERVQLSDGRHSPF